MTRRHDVRRVKLHLCYTAVEIANLFRVRVTTVRNWIRDGLTPIDDRKPFLFAGACLAEFVAARNKPRQPCCPGEIYCVACKKPMVPTGNEALLELRSETTADLIGRCPACNRRSYRRVRLAEWKDRAGQLHVIHQDGSAPVSSDSKPARTNSSVEVAP